MANNNGRLIDTANKLRARAGLTRRTALAVARTTSEDDVLDLMSVDMSDPANTGWFRVNRDSARKAMEGAGPNRIGYEADRRDYASSMRVGEWVNFYGSAFHFDRDGRLRRGFHRVHAVIMADAEIVVWVICGAIERGIEVDDRNNPWSTHDHMTQKTGIKKKSLAETVFHARIILGLSPRPKGRHKGVECAKFYDENIHIFSAIEEKLEKVADNSVRKSLRLASIQVAFHELYLVANEHFDHTMDALQYMDIGTAKNFRKLLDKCYARGGGGPAMKDHYAWAKYAIVKYVNGESISGDKWPGDSDLSTMTARRSSPSGRRTRRDEEGRYKELPGQEHLRWEQ